MFLTGSLLLNKKYDSKEAVIYFYKHNLLNLIIVCEIWYIIYFIIDVFIFKKTIFFKDLILTLLFAKQYPLSHAWYIPMIIGLYATIPFVGIAVQKFPKIVKIIMCINILYVFGIQKLNTIFETMGSSYHLTTTFSIPFGGGGIYGTYILVGYFIDKGLREQNHHSNIKNVFTVGVLIISFAITVLIRYKLGCDSWYDMFTILICSASIFILLQKIKLSVKLHKILKKLSIGTFGVYLIHMLIINLMNEFGLKEAIELGFPIISIIYFVITIIISYAIVLLLSRNKYISKYLLFIK